MSTIVLPDSFLLGVWEGESTAACRVDGVGELCLGKRTIDSTNLAAELKIRAPVLLGYWAVSCGHAKPCRG